MKRLVAAVVGVVIGAVVGCGVVDHLSVDIRREIDVAVNAWCMKQLGACGQKSVWYNRCTGRVEIHGLDGEVRQSLSRAMEINDEAMGPTCDMDQPKMTRYWRCKKRQGKVYCHIYNPAASVFGAFVKANPARNQNCGRWRDPSDGFCPPRFQEL
jgi:hypothetical protein